MPTCQIADGEGLVVTISAKGGYAPDLMHDLKNRTKELYQETLSFRIAANQVGQVQMVFEEAGEDE